MASELPAPILSSQTLALHKAAPADFPRLLEIQFSAFLDPFQYEPYHEVLYPGGNTASARAAALVRVQQDFETEQDSVFLKVVDTSTGQIIAGGKWCAYHVNDKGPGEGEGVKATWMKDETETERDRKEYTEHILTGLYNVRRKWTDKQPYYALEMLYTDPKHQKRGAGQLVMEWGLGEARKLGYQSILESTRWARHLYEKNGYSARERVYLELPEKWLWRTPVQYWIMHRPKEEVKVEAETENGDISDELTGMEKAGEQVVSEKEVADVKKEKGGFKTLGRRISMMFGGEKKAKA